MGNTLIFRKTLLLLAFLHSFYIFSQQYENRNHVWEGDMADCTWDGKSLTCNTDEELTVYIRRNDKAPATWAMQIYMPDGELSGIRIYPIVRDLDRLDSERHFHIQRNRNSVRYISYIDTNKSIITETSVTGYTDNNTISLRLSLDSDCAWQASVGGYSVLDDKTIKSTSDTSEAFAITFKGMKGTRISNLEIISDMQPEEPDDGNQEPDDSDNDDSNEGDGDNSGNDESDEDEQPDNEGTTGLAYGDIVISEVMANPSNVAGLPEAEYIEIYNRTDSVINTDKWTLRYGKTSYSMDGGILQPGAYVIMSKKTNSESWDNAGIYDRIDMTRFPTLANSGNTLFIHDASDNLVAFTHYTESRYGDEFKAVGGFSLERIDTENINDTPRNWHASKDLSGGTPGRENSVKGTCNSYEPAAFLYAGTLSADTLRLYFNSPVDIATACDMDNYTINESETCILSISCDSIYQSYVDLELDTPMDDDTYFRLTMEGIKQIDHSDVIFPESITVTDVHKPIPDELTFNEILFDNSTETAEYVELFNRSDKCLDISRLSFAIVNEDGTFGRNCRLSTTPHFIAPGQYIAFTSDTAAIAARWNVRPWQSAICQLPALRNDGGTIALVDESAEQMDVAVFTPKIYSSTGKGSTDIASEKINPALSSGNPSNWQPATMEYNYGTPGKQNSQFSETKPTGNMNSFRLQYDCITPDNDGDNDFAILNYNLDQNGYIVNIRIFDSKGRMVATPVQRETLAAEGSIIIPGTDSEDCPLEPGIYILLIDAHTDNGSKITDKIALAVN